MTGPCRAPGPNDPSCGYDSESGRCETARCRYTDGRDTDPSERSFVAPGSAEHPPRGVAVARDLAQDAHGGTIAAAIGRLAALAEAGQGARTRKDAGVILDVVARGLRLIEKEMRQG